MKEKLSESIKKDIDAIISDQQYLKYLSEYLKPTGNMNWNDAKYVIDAQRSEFLAGKEAALEDLCQKYDLAARVYTGYDKDSNSMRFWPTEERAQVVFLAGYAALEGHRIDTAKLGAFVA